MKFKEILRERGYRVTRGRTNILKFLASTKKPLTASEILEKIDIDIDKVTLYRALEEFVKSNLVAKINLRHNAAHYEFIRADHHHHHIICEVCSKLEDIESCEPLDLQKQVLKSSKNFKTINSHSLEFFGICTLCSKE